MRWILFIALIIGLLYLGDHTHQYVSNLSLIEIGNTTDKIQDGWQFWNGQTESAKFAPFYNKVDGWHIFIQLWPVAAILILLCVLLIPMSVYLFGRLSRGFVPISAESPDLALRLCPIRSSEIIIPNINDTLSDFCTKIVMTLECTSRSQPLLSLKASYVITYLSYLLVS